jgi:ABC-type transport system involved in multi-copper enzyme maturation permease subunit
VRTVFSLAWERAGVRIAVLALGFALFELVLGLSYASVDQNAIRQLVDALPPALRALAGSADIATPTGYAGSGYLHPVALALPAAAAISMAAAPAREAEDGTAELVLSRPLPPPRWLGAHALAMATGLAVVVAGGYLGGLVASGLVDDLAPVDAGPLALALLGSYACFLAVGGVALLVASLVRSGGRVVAWASGFVIVSYAVDYLAQVWSVAEPLGPLSVFRYLDPPAVLRAGSLGAEDVAALGGLALATTLAALVLVDRRDLTP